MAFCCYQLLKIVVITMILVNIGTGYLKFYKLFSNIGDTLANIGDTTSFDDLVWIPFLIIQCSTTILQCIQLYCLIRELCVDNFMYKYCFKCCFILTFIIYALSVVPKSIIAILYNKYNTSWEDVWKVLADFLDSSLSALAVFGFQIILFIPTIRKILRSAGACKNKIRPTGVDKTQSGPDEEYVTHGNGCCFSACCRNQTTETDAEGNKRQQKLGGVTDKVRNAGNSVADKANKMKSSMQAKQQHLELRVNNAKERHTQRYDKFIEERKTKIKEIKQQQLDKIEDKVKKRYDKGQNSNNAKENYDDDVIDDVTSATNKNCCSKCCDYMCGCMDRNRTLCFLVLLLMSSLHFLIYIVEIVLLFCVVC